MRRICLIGCITVCLTAFAADRPVPIVVFADDTDYKAAKATEMIFEGILERTPTTGTLGGPSRFNPYRLSGRDGAGKPWVRDLFVANKAPLLAVHVGQRLRVVGKIVEVESDGKKQLELWPARLEAVSQTLVEKPGTDGVYARVFWQPTSAQKSGFRFFVFRDGAQLAREMKLTGTTASDSATTLMAGRFSVPAIDWNKHMVVTVSAGLRGPNAEVLKVTHVAIEDEKMTILYKLEVGGPGFGYPAETVLVDRFSGAVHVEDEKPTPKKD